MKIRILIYTCFVVVLFGLFGCASQSSIQNPKNICRSTQVLYTNLTKAPEGRNYILADGTDCTRYYRG